MPINNISYAMPAKQFEDLNTQIDALRSSMSFLVDLTPEQKQRMVRAGEQNMTFARLIRDLSGEHGGILPAAVDFDEFKRDIELYEQLRLIKIKLDPLIELVDDSQTASGADAYQTALTLYGVAKALNLEGMEEAQRMMSQRFSNNGNYSRDGSEAADVASLVESVGA